MTDTQKPLAIRCKGLIKVYSTKHSEMVVAVNRLDLEVKAGECFGLLGPNGAGKTTTVEILEGLLSPNTGDVELFGKTWAQDEPWLRERLGISLQHTHLPERLTVRETVELFRSFYAPRGRNVDETIDLVALKDKEDARFETLSGGQRQRLAVACALVGDPQLLFLDEPTTGLDPQSRRMLWEVVLAFKLQGGSVLLTTHYMDEAERLCDRVGVIDHGQMIALGTPKELIESLGGQQIVEFTLEDGVEVNLEPLGALPSVHGARWHTGRVSLTVSQLHEALPALLAHIDGIGGKLTSLSTHHATLEDVFVNLTGRQLRE
ncbi:ATP-binding cassette domain-containing protein [Pendulispora albinea]|uniref:ABC transporter ATP-binding protein n=1 Tax=Pendulispora albinea TaxID=2741071 RepID=A0ABZ2LYF4_9BACT